MREHGVKISIDDFGIGYSSLSYFRGMPTDELKIDQSLVMGLKSDKTNIDIGNLIIVMTHRFGLRVVVEGVEDSEVIR